MKFVKDLDTIVCVCLLLAFVGFPITMFTRNKILERQQEEEYVTLTSMPNRPYTIQYDTVPVVLTNKAGKRVGVITDKFDISEQIMVEATFAVWNDSKEKTLICYSTLEKFERMGMFFVRGKDSTIFRMGEYYTTFEIGSNNIDSIVKVLNTETEKYKKEISLRWDAYYDKYIDRRY